jgi:type VI secretion system protein
VTLFTALTVGLVSACGPKIATRSFSVSAAEDANDRSPVPVDLVLVRDEALLDELLLISASDWFARRDQIIRDRFGELEIMTWEFVPGQTLSSLEVRFEDRSAHALLLFARYLAEGPHRIRVEEFERFNLRLEARRFLVEIAGS